MKTTLTTLPGLLLLAAALAAQTPPAARAQAAPMTPEQLAQIAAKIDELRNVVEGRFSDLNKSAGEVFRQAAQDPKSAVELYAKCYREVHFVREGRDDSDFKDWQDSQKDTFRDPRFIEGILVQLRYLALSCEAAEAETLDAVFPALLAHVESLTKLTQVPSQQILMGVNQSVFAQAYKLDDLLSRNREWEMVPIDIGGIYEKTVLPYLRKGDPARLMAAWDRRIAQQTQLAGFLGQMESMGSTRDDRKASENRAKQLQQGKAGGVIREYSESDFMERTLPMLNWAKMRDMAIYADQAQGLSGMVAFLQENLEHPRITDFLDELQSLLKDLSASAPPSVTSSVPETPAPPVAVPPAPGVPPGLE